MGPACNPPYQWLPVVLGGHGCVNINLDDIFWRFFLGDSSTVVPSFSVYSDYLLLDTPSGDRTSGSDSIGFVLSIVGWPSPS